MDIHQEKWDYTAMLVAENAITQEQCDTLKLSDGMNIFYSDHLASTTIDCINWGWSSWLKAKAQAIPDGYVLMPKEPNREFKDRLRSYLDNLWMGDHGCDWDYFVDATAIKPNEIWRFMIEAQEPAND